ncbi:unnamed protein product [Acanthoscelides obtectus]|nr:unnamed protein product [Acanthoscelides obtectus]CAK1672485.1 Villin-like protein quail [Acanthoscelides obtectus]
MNVIALPREQYGTFINTECYIVYAACQYGQSCTIDTVERDAKDVTLEYHIHFWIGSETTPDKSGVAAYKTVELDNFIGGHAVQHREAESNESSRFLSYLKNGIKILTNKSKRIYPKLYKILKRKTPILMELSGITWQHFSSSEVMILRTSKIIYIWIGRNANEAEKKHALMMAFDMKQNSSDEVVFVDDGYEKTLPSNLRDRFNHHLPLSKRLIVPHSEKENDTPAKHVLKLYKCAENNGKYRVVEIKNGPFHQKDLNSDKVFIIDDSVSSGVWVWVGQHANDKERTEALRNARGFIKKKKYEWKTRVTRVVEGHEPPEFKVLFHTWTDELKVIKPVTLLYDFDAATMADRPSLAAETQLIDDGSGTLSIWRIGRKSITKIPEERHGYFFSEDCYITLYTYQISEEKQMHLLYYWLGSHASQDEIDLTLLRINEMDEELGKIGFQARLIQGNETPHFLQLFKGKLVIFKGKGSDYDESGKNKKCPSHYLLQATGSTTYNSKAVQVDTRSSSLNSNYCFILKKSKRIYIWCGSHSTGDQREMAKGFAGKSFDLILEGKETGDFFNLLGGKMDYHTKTVQKKYSRKPARLIYLLKWSNERAEELVFFEQADLLPEHVILLDIDLCLYIWIGNFSSEEEKSSSFKKAIEYLQSDPSKRDMSIAIIHIKQDHEPPIFTGFFPSWNKDFWKAYKPFLVLRKEIEKVPSSTHSGRPELTKFDQYDKYPVSILRKPNDELPAKVNPLNKEMHLTHDDFVTLFKMPYSEFAKLPSWKQKEIKKTIGLF